MNTIPARRPLLARIALALLSVLGVLVAAAVLYVILSQTALLPAFFRQPRPVLAHAEGRDARWRQDLRYLATQLPRLHADAFFHIPEEDWRTAVAGLDSRIPELSDSQIMIEMTRLVASIGDGHTRLWAGGGSTQTMYPLVLRWFPDGLYVVASAPEHAHAVGARVVQIDGTDLPLAYDTVASLISHDNDAALLAASPQLLVSPEILAVLGITNATDRAAYLLEGQDGVQRAVEVRAVDAAGWGSEYVGVADVNPSLADRVPLYLSNRQDYYWFEFLPESKTLFFQYNRCNNMASLPFEDFAKDLFAVVDRENPRRIVVDLRFNGGGNSAVLGPFLEGLEQRQALNEEGQLFAIIGRDTYSSALMNALDIQNLGGVLVGEPTGGKPNAYGEVHSFRLPNSGFQVQFSTRYWRLLEDSDPPSVLPDLPAELSIADYLGGDDVALRAILAYPAP